MGKEDDVFWHPNIYEWRAYCELHPECDPKSTLLLKDGGYRFIPKEEAPLDEVAEGKRIQRERKEAEEQRQREELARTKEEAEAESLRNAVMLEKMRKQELKKKEYSKVTQARHSAKMKAVTTDDPFVASVANAVDKDKKSANANYIVHAKRLSDLPRIALSDPEAIRDRVDWY